MAKPEWGTKRACPSCGVRFYDLNREPIVCPSCGEPVEIVVGAKQRRSRPAPKLAVASVVAAKAPAKADKDAPDLEEVEDDAEAAPDDAEGDTSDDNDDDGESAIEDVSELGDDDVSGVIDADLDDDETER